MLSPGEFVVNARATKKNMGLLKAINGGAKGYSKGGVAYLEEGGVVGDLDKKVQEARNQQKIIRQEMLNDKETFFYWALSNEGGKITNSWESDYYKDGQLQNPTNTPDKKAWFESDRQGRYREGEGGYRNQQESGYDKSNPPAMYELTHEYLANTMGRETWDKLSANDQDAKITTSMVDFDTMFSSLTKEARANDLLWWQTKTYKEGTQAALQKMRDAQARVDAIETQIRADEQEISRLQNPQKDPQTKAKNEAQAQEAEKTSPVTLSEAAKLAAESIKVNSEALINAATPDEAVRAQQNINTGLNELATELFNVDSSSISDTLGASPEQILETRNNQSSALQGFYDTIVAPALGGLANQVGAQPSQPPQPPVPPVPDPYANMNARQKMLAIRAAEYQASQKAKRESFRKSTGRDPVTGQIGGAKIPLTNEQKANNKRRAEIRATRAASGGKDFNDELTPEERKRLNKAELDFERSLSPEQIKNRKRAERTASMPTGIGGYYGAEEGRMANKPYGAAADQAEFVSELSPEQIANRERIERISISGATEQTPEQQEKLEILRTPIDQRSPEQIARLEELRRERSKLIYASKGRLVNFQPRGSDTVPAMLTPGEFVVNRKATKQNLGLLQQINSQKFNSGGLVQSPQYLAEGGGALKASSGSSGNGVLSIDTTSLDSAFSPFNSSVSSFSSAVDQFGNVAGVVAGAFSGLDNVVNAFTALSAASSLLSGTATGLGTAISSFNTAVGQLGTVLGSIPESISLNVSGSIPVSVNVTVNGGEGLGEKLDTFKDQIYNEISAGISEATSGRLRINLNTSKR
jgi:hypothetical protein